MKDSFSKLIFFYILIIIIFHTNLKSEEIKFESDLIETSDKDTIIASGNVKIKNNFNQVITSDKLKVDKLKNTYTLIGNVYLNDASKYEILSGELIINKRKDEYIFNNNVIIKENNNSLIAKTSQLTLNNINKTIFSKDKTIINDSYGNTIETNEFKLFNKKNYLSATKVILKDKESNVYFIDELRYDLGEKKIYGKDVSINTSNNISSKEFLPRSKSRSIIIDKDFSILKKSVYTNCKKRDGCPPWLIVSDEIIHDKNKKIINYKNSIFKLFDVPIMYFPKFFHPDPTVNRQSGFLTPTLSTQNSSSYIKLPYYFAISDNSDFTFTPRLYNNSKNIYQGEYRKVTKRTDNVIDFGIKNDDPLLTQNNSSNTHLFIESKINTNFDYFETSNFDISLKAVSNEKYLKTYNVKSALTDSQTSLTSSLKFEGFRDDLDFLISTEVYEDLSKNDLERYEYIAPNFSLSKNIDTKIDGVLNFNSTGYNKIFNTDTNEKILINDFIYESLDSFNQSGIISNYEINIKNFNSDSKNSTTLKNELENDIQGLVQLNSKYPLVKEGIRFDKHLMPIIAFKFNPFKNKDISEDDRLINYNNIFSSNRIGSNQTLESGTSLTIGNEYKIFSKLDESKIFGFNLATSLRLNENRDLPKKSSLGEKTSNFVGQIDYKLNSFIDFQYDFITKDNMKDFDYHKIKSKFKVNNFVTSFEFLEENNLIGNKSFISNETSLKIDENKNLLFRTRKNKKNNLTEYYDLIYQYKMDCLTAGLEYRKNYYTDGLLKPEESIFLSITFMPFGSKVNLPGIN